MLIYQRVSQDFWQSTHGNLWEQGLFPLYSTSRFQTCLQTEQNTWVFDGKTDNSMVEITHQHQVFLVGWTSCSFNFFFLKSCICSLGLRIWMFGNNRKILWKFDCEYFHLQGPVNVHCRQTTARRSRRRRRPRSVMSLKVLVVFLVDPKCHPESYHPSEIIKFTSWRVIKQCPWTGL